MLKIVAVFLVVTGLCFIIQALRSAITFYLKDKRLSTFSFLPIMLGFTLGYVVFSVYLINKPIIEFIELIVSMIFFGGGIFTVMTFSVISQSIERIAKAELQQWHQVSFDELTGLPNRRYLLKALRENIAEFKASGNEFALVSLNINNFNNINEVFTHQECDELFLAFSQRLQENLISDTLLFRSSTHRFAFFIKDTEQIELSSFIENLHCELEAPLPIKNYEVNLTNCFGIALYPSHTNTADDLIKKSESAMHAAHRSQEPFIVYESSATAALLSHDEIASMLNLAIRNMDFELFFQPVFNIKNPKKISMEALLRWPLGKGRYVSNDEFIPIAEQTYAIRKITRWVLETVFKQLEIWNEQGLSPQIQVNLSTKDLEDNEFDDYLRSLLERYQVSPSALILEITETSLMQDPDKCRLMLEKISHLGITLSVDDFGAGFSSLSILSNMPIDELKIDRSFVTDLLTSRNHEAIVRSTVYLAHSLGCEVVAEGVETEALGQYLMSIGCDKLQGYWYGRPMNLAKTDQWLRDIDVYPRAVNQN
ncbi:GGDEF-domain containing protein [Veronia nyctiphanis]|uniref:GGDEF-domain containing protein n=1 Tax=Veronia nyctiphanis TaxID=1278244 RepID=A0A4Q0YUI9_9GAMM|nr:GGDEF domain-containing phosphodiesterase [Veronia nyctiphanis]RXJ74956.1 GGDEF-domain containing protein [Veronia nyctiphanis]